MALTENSSATHADKALKMLRTTYGTAAASDERIIDALADIMHLAAREELSFTGALRIARRHFNEEKGE